jgi:hypothetical protein
MIGRKAKFLPEESGPPRYIKEYIFKKPKSPFCHTKKTLSISANPRATLQPFQQLKKIEKNEVFKCIQKCIPHPMIFIRYNQESKSNPLKMCTPLHALNGAKT